MAHWADCLARTLAYPVASSTRPVIPTVAAARTMDSETAAARAGCFFIGPAARADRNRSATATRAAASYPLSVPEPLAGRNTTVGMSSETVARGRGACGARGPGHSDRSRR